MIALALRRRCAALAILAGVAVFCASLATLGPLLIGLVKAGVMGTLIRYPPLFRYWPFPLIEAAILLALSALLVTAELRRATRP